MTCCCVGGRLEPDSPTIVAAATYNQHYDEYYQKCSRVHDALLWPRNPSRVRVHQQPPVLRVRGWLKEHQRPCPRKQQVPVGHPSSRPIATILRQHHPHPQTTMSRCFHRRRRLQPKRLGMKTIKLKSRRAIPRPSQRKPRPPPNNRPLHQLNPPANENSRSLIHGRERVVRGRSSTLLRKGSARPA